MANRIVEKFIKDKIVPTILVVGCGSVGSHIVKTFVDNFENKIEKIYVTDNDKEKANKLSEYRISLIKPIKWRHAHDTPDDVDILVIALPSYAEEKIIDKIALCSKPFVSLSDDSHVFDLYCEYDAEFKGQNVSGVIGCGLVPGISDVLISHVAKNFTKVNDISVDRLGFVSSSSLDSIKTARKESPLCVRDGQFSDSRRDAGNNLTWFVKPYNNVECQSVATGVISIANQYESAHNITVRFAEPKLPTFSERVKNIFFKIPLTTTFACVKVQVHGQISKQFDTKTIVVYGNAMTIIAFTCLFSLVGLINKANDSEHTFLTCGEVIDSRELFTCLYDLGINFYEFEN